MQQARKFFGNTTDALLLVSLLYIVAVMPFQKPEVPLWPGLALITGTWLFSGGLKSKALHFLSQRQAVIFTLLYLFYCIGYVYSSDVSYAKTDLLLKVPLLLLPVVLTWPIVKNKTETVLKVFYSACLVSAALCMARAGWLTYTTGENYFYYYKLSWFFHVGHYAMYLAFAALITVYLFRKEDRKNLKLLYAFSFVFFTVTLLLLSARAQIAAFAFILFCGGIYYLLKKENRKTGLPLFCGLFALLVAGAYFIPGNGRRFRAAQTELKLFFGEHKKQKHAQFLRFAIWESAWEVIRQHPLAGVGTGDAKSRLLEEAKKKEYSIIVKNNLNYHNQFLQTWASTGLPGLCTLLFSICAGFIYSLKKQKFLPAAFFMLIAMSFFTESMLERQAGVIFYSFFGVLFILRPEQQTQE